MPKRNEDRQIRAEYIRRWIREGRLSAFPAGTNRLLRVHRVFRATFPAVRIRDREREKRRMIISAGSYLNSRWMKVGKSWDVWPDILACRTPEDVAGLRERSIVNVDGVWHIQIYEVVSGVNKLRRQRVKIRAKYYQEKIWRNAVIASVEADIASEAAGSIKLSPAERRSLEELNRQIQARLAQIDIIGGKLSPREVFAYAGGWVELAQLERTKRSLELALNQVLIQPLDPRFDQYLLSKSEELAAIASLEIRRPRFWAQYHLRKAAEALREGPQARSVQHIQRTIEHLSLAIETLKGWAQSLTEEEERHVIPA